MEEKTISGYSLRIREIRETLNLKIADFARKLYVPRSTLVGWENGKSVSIEILKPLEEILNVNIDWVLTGEGEMFLSSQDKSLEIAQKSGESYKVPLLNQKVSCGSGSNWEDEQNVSGYIDVFSIIPRLKLGRLFAFSAQGNSMVGAGIKSGDYVLFDTTLDLHYKDDIYVFSLDGEVFCKQLEFDSISKKVKIYSIRVADLEKAELLTTFNIDEADFADRFHIFGRVDSWVHPNSDVAKRVKLD